MSATAFQSSETINNTRRGGKWESIFSFQFPFFSFSRKLLSEFECQAKFAYVCVCVSNFVFIHLLWTVLKLFAVRDYLSVVIENDWVLSGRQAVSLFWSYGWMHECLPPAPWRPASYGGIDNNRGSGDAGQTMSRIPFRLLQLCLSFHIIHFYLIRPFLPARPYIFSPVSLTDRFMINDVVNSWWWWLSCMIFLSLLLLLYAVVIFRFLPSLYWRIFFGLFLEWISETYQNN